LAALFLARLLTAEREVRAKRLGQRQPLCPAAQDNNLARAHLFRQGCTVEPQASCPLNDHRVPESDTDLVEAVERFTQGTIDRGGERIAQLRRDLANGLASV